VETGKDHLACEEYSVPPHIQEHIDFIKPTVHFDAYVKPKRKRRDLPGREISERSMKVKPFPIVRPGAEVTSQVQYSLSNCDQYTTPECLRALYNFSNGTLSEYVNSILLKENLLMW
jgi:tripeptidyl-peptidase-1